MKLFPPYAKCYHKNDIEGYFRKKKDCSRIEYREFPVIEYVHKYQYKEYWGNISI